MHYKFRIILGFPSLSIAQVATGGPLWQQARSSPGLAFKHVTRCYRILVVQCSLRHLFQLCMLVSHLLPGHLFEIKIVQTVLNAALQTLKFKLDNKYFGPAWSKSKDFYNLLIKEKATQSLQTEVSPN